MRSVELKRPNMGESPEVGQAATPQHAGKPWGGRQNSVWGRQARNDRGRQALSSLGGDDRILYGDDRPGMTGDDRPCRPRGRQGLSSPVIPGLSSPYRILSSTGMLCLEKGNPFSSQDETRGDDRISYGDDRLGMTGDDRPCRPPGRQGLSWRSPEVSERQRALQIPNGGESLRSVELPGMATARAHACPNMRGPSLRNHIAPTGECEKKKRRRSYHTTRQSD